MSGEHFLLEGGHALLDGRVCVKELPQSLIQDFLQPMALLFLPGAREPAVCACDFRILQGGIPERINAAAGLRRTGERARRPSGQ